MCENELEIYRKSSKPISEFFTDKKAFQKALLNRESRENREPTINTTTYLSPSTIPKTRIDPGTKPNPSNSLRKTSTLEGEVTPTADANPEFGLIYGNIYLPSFLVELLTLLDKAFIWLSPIKKKVQVIFNIIIELF